MLYEIKWCKNDTNPFRSFSIAYLFLTGQASLSPCQIDYSVAISKVIDTTKDFKIFTKDLVNLGTSFLKNSSKPRFVLLSACPDALTNKLHIVITTKANWWKVFYMCWACVFSFTENQLCYIAWLMLSDIMSIGYLSIMPSTELTTF